MNRHVIVVVVVLAACQAWEARGAEPCTGTPAGVIGWWPGDGNSTDVVSTNSGILIGNATVSAAGLVLSGFGFDGTNSFVQIPDSPLLRPANFTVEAWVRFRTMDSPGTAPAGRQYIIFRQNTRSGGFEGFVLNKDRISGADYLVFGVTSATGVEAEIRGSTPLSTNVWYHVAGVRGSNFLQLYVNGQLQGQAAVAFPQDYGNYPIYLGTSGQPFWDRKFAGFLDEVTLYDRALSANEIASIFVSGSAGKCKQITITAHPGSQTVVQGANVTFTVAARGLSPVSYQWLLNGTGIPGATTSSYALAAVHPGNNGAYSVVLSNAFGTTTSSAAALKVIAPPVITSQPQGRTNIAGTTATFSVAATGTDLLYQWRQNGLALPGATQSVLGLPNVQPNHNGNYSVVLSNLAGAVTSSSAALKVVVPPVITSQPQNRTNIAGTTATFSVAATGTDLLYQWRQNGVALPGATQSVLGLPNVQPDNNGNYSVVLSNLAGEVTSSSAELKVVVSPVITVSPQSRTNIAGTTATFTVGATGTDLTYSWSKNGVALPGATQATLAIPNVAETQAGNYSITVDNLAGSVTRTASLTVWVPPLVVSAPNDAWLDQGGTLELRVDVRGTAPFTYQWSFYGSPLPGATQSFYVRTNVQPADTGLYDVTVANVAGVTNLLAYVEVTPLLPSIKLQPASQSVSIGSPVVFRVTVTGPGPFTYQWRKNGTNIGGQVGATLYLPRVTEADQGNYSVLVANAMGSTASEAAILTVVFHPVITRQPLSRTEYPRTNAYFISSAQGLGLTYYWQKNGTNLVNGPKVSGANTQVLQLNGLAAGDRGSYRLLVTNAAGLAASDAATLDVLDPFIVTQPASIMRTVGAFVCLTVEAEGSSPLSYQWRRGSVNLADGGHIAGARATTLVFDGVQPADAGNYTVVVSHSSGAVTSSVVLLEVAQHVVFADERLSNAVRCALAPAPLDQFLWPSNLHGLTCLSAADLGIARVSGLELASNLRELVLGGNQITDIRHLGKLTQLETLDLSRNRIEDIGILSELTNLTCLVLGQNQITNYSPLAGLYGLTQLHIRSGAMLNAESLQSLIELRSLSLWENGIEDVSPLAGLTNLTCLDLRYNVINDPSPVTFNASSLVSLYLAGNPITNLPPLGNLRQLKLLNVDDCYLEDLSPVAELSELTYLSASRNALSDFSVLSSLTSLEGLELRSSKLEQIDFVADMRALAFADLAYNNLQDVTAFNGRTNLSLVLDGNTNLNTTALTSLGGLSRLWVNGVGLADINFLSAMPQLTALGLENNRITNFSPLAALPNLQLLAVSGNRGVSYSFLGSFTNLAVLKAEHNRLSDVSFLNPLRQLRFLSLNRNEVSDLSPLAALTGLESLYAQRNRITETQTNAVFRLSKLRHADFRYNLFSQDSTALDPLACLRVDGLLCGCGAGTNELNALPCRAVEVMRLPQRLPPRISAPATHYLPSGKAGTVKVKVWDEIVWDDALTVTASSSNPALIPNESLQITGTNENLAVTMTSVSATGEANVFITVVNEAGLSATGQVHVSVLPAISLSNMICVGATLDPAFVNSLSRSADEFGEVTSVDLLNVTDLSVRGSPAGFCGWTWMTNVQMLTINGTAFTDLSVLTNFPGLQVLDLIDWPDAGFSTMPIIGTVTNLILTGQGVKSLSFLSQLPGLKSLTVINGSVTNFWPLGALQGITSLTLVGNNIEDVRFLAEMPQLEEVSLDSNRIRDISPVGALPFLRKLSVQDNYLTNATTLLNTRLLTYCDVALNVLNFNEPYNSAVYRALTGSGATFNYLPQRPPPSVDVRTNWFVNANVDSSITFRIDDGFARGVMSVGVTSSQPAAVSNPRVTPATFPYWSLDISAGSAGGTSIVTLSATNDAGVSSATRIAVSVGPFFSLNGSGVLDSPQLFWSTADPKPWFGQNWFTSDGVAAAQSGTAGDYQTSQMATAISGPGTLAFWWRISSETNYDWLQFQVDGVTWEQISGEVGWQPRSFKLPHGDHTVAWVYTKDRDNSFGFDAAWVDRVAFTPDAHLHIAVDTPNNRMLLTVTADSGLGYVLERSTNLVNWLDLFPVVLTNGSLTIPYTNSSQGMEFFRLKRTSAGVAPIRQVEPDSAPDRPFPDDPPLESPATVAWGATPMLRPTGPFRKALHHPYS